MSAALGAAGGPDLLAQLARDAAALQRSARLPTLSVALASAASAPTSVGIGDPEPTADTQYRIGSITKTFTAVLVLQLRDEGRLPLDDPLATHLPAAVFGEAGQQVAQARIRDLLAHLAGMRREPPGAFWEAVPGPTPSELLAGRSADDMVLPARRAPHYSNLAYALLGQVVAHGRGAAFPEVLQARLLDPLNLRRTSWTPTPPHAIGYRVHPFADELREEPHADTAAMGPAGQLWSTPTDLTTWGRFLADPDPAVLSRDTIEEMCEPVAMADPQDWTSGYGLGLQLFRRGTRAGDRVFVGHGGSMPGFVAGLAVARHEGVVAGAAANAWAGADLASFAAGVVVRALDEQPPAVERWRAAPPPPEVKELVGPWYYRGAALVLAAEGPLPRLGPAADLRGPRSRLFEPVGPDLFRGMDGGDRGELLRAVRDDTGHVVVLDVATWLLTRTPEDPRGGP